MTVTITAEKRKYLSNAGFNSPEDYILRLPIDYTDFSEVITGGVPLPHGGKHCFHGVINKSPISSSTHKTLGGKRIRFFSIISVGQFQITIEDTRILNKSPFSKLAKGDEVYIYGDISLSGGMPTIYCPELISPQWAGKIRPTYKGVHRALTPVQMFNRVQESLSNKQLLRLAAKKISIELGCYTIGTDEIINLLVSAHSPPSINTAKEVMDTLHDLNIKSLLSKNIEVNTDNLSSIVIDDSTVNDLHNEIPFTLSESQALTMRNIRSELAANKPMDMLASGDVGSGKSIIQILSCLYAFKANKRSAIIAPNELLAVQLFESFQSLFPNVPCHLIAKNTSRDIDLSVNPILIGTTAIIFFVEKHPGFSLNLLCIDEQQKIGLNQKKRVTSLTTNLLESTATCIPRSMGNILFTGKKVSRISAHVKKDIKSHVTSYEDREKMFHLLRSVINDGGKVAIIYPEIKAKKRTALLESEKYWHKHYPDQYSILYGGMKPEVKKAAIKDVLSGKYPLLLATSIIEIGLDVPDLRMMIVVDADEYGASTLHQMRGRLGRNGGGGIFFMYTSKHVTKESNFKSYERLQLVKKYNDGFIIAEKDMESRGVGDIIGDGDRQSGKTLGVFIGLPIEAERLSKHLQ